MTVPTRLESKTMDPNTLLETIRKNVEGIVNDWGGADIVELSEAFEVLDHWLTQGKPLPTEWERS